MKPAPPVTRTRLMGGLSWMRAASLEHLSIRQNHPFRSAPALGRPVIDETDRGGRRILLPPPAARARRRRRRRSRAARPWGRAGVGVSRFPCDPHPRIRPPTLTHPHKGGGNSRRARGGVLLPPPAARARRRKQRRSRAARRWGRVGVGVSRRLPMPRGIVFTMSPNTRSPCPTAGVTHDVSNQR